MKNIAMMITMAGALLATLPAHANVNVFACEPEWGSLAKEIGGEHVTVTSATNAQQDPHHIRARPSLIAAMRRADVLVCSGASLEIGWLPILLQKAGNKNVQPNAVGYVMAADYVPMLEVPNSVDRSAGDVHPEGNPHVHLNPHNIATMGHVLAERLAQVDAANAGFYQQQEQNFQQRWQQAITKWESETNNLKGVGFVPHHKSWIYLADWLGLKEVATLEPKPGIPPTTAHLQDVLATVKQEQPRWIVRTPYANADASEWVSAKTGVPALVLPYTVGGSDQAQDLFGLFDQTVSLLVENK